MVNSNIELPCLLITSDNKLITKSIIFVELLAPKRRVADLQYKVKKRCSNALKDVDDSDLIVWNCGIPATPLASLNKQKAIDDAFQKDMQPLHEAVDLESFDGSLLLVQVPNSQDDKNVHGRPAKVPTGAESFVFERLDARTFLREDLDANCIDIVSKRSYDFVDTFERRLSQPRPVPSCFPGKTSISLVPPTTGKYPRAEGDTKAIATHGETLQIASAAWDGFLTEKRAVGFKEEAANSLIFYHFEKIISDKSGPRCIFGKDRGRYFPFVVKYNGGAFKYKPQPDFAILGPQVHSGFRIPQLAVEVNSTAQGGPRIDQYRLFLQAGSIVRLANRYRTDGKRHFVFVAIYISFNAVAERRLFFQNPDDDDDNTVYSKEVHYHLVSPDGRVAFLHELHNLCDKIMEDGQSPPNTNQFTDLFHTLVEELDQLDTLNDGTKRKPDEEGGGDGSRKKSKKSKNDGGQQTLSDAGYVVQAAKTYDFGEDNAYMTPLYQEPDNIRTVWRKHEPRTCYVAKRVRHNSREVDVLRFLQETEPRSPHIISLVEAIQSESVTWLIMPKLDPIKNLTRNAEEALDLSRDLIAGLDYLHRHNVAHLDIKPANLALHPAQRYLVILDFDTAVRLSDENQKMVGFRGTKGWTAPELGDYENDTVTYKPIPADLWACGRVIDFFFDWEEDHRLRPLTQRLAANDPDERPSMKECLEWMEGEGGGKPMDVEPR